MAKKTVVMLCAFIIPIVFFTVIAYSFYSRLTGEIPVKVTTAKIETELKFKLNDNKGIPGEIIAISYGTYQMAENTIVKATNSADYIFKLTYEVTYEDEDDLDFINDLKLNNIKADELGLIKNEPYDKLTRKVTYLGKHEGDGDLELGELFAEFDILKNPSMGKGFEIEANIVACQKTANAVKDVFGINPEDSKYADLFK